MEQGKILLAMKSDAAISKLKAILVESRYQIIDQAKAGNECLRKMRSYKTDIAIIDFNLPGVNGFEVAKIAVEDKLCDVILIMNNDQKNSINYINYEYDFNIITTPINKTTFINTVELTIKNRIKVIKLEQEIQKLKKALDSRKDIEKAKWVLMKHMKLTEEDAFKKIQKQSMDTGTSMKEIAKAIILSYKV
ncbi:ANTAR domain-containing protein [Clostridium bovifaecis]|uniref:Stage 0 sporulation protein A homolog n=1 Tax=Clostridium bovifaecis TaxID=2184719 RepID=A0A6I6F0G3_9CLOT|nr:ANTAR domain-containing protein [Clostridium bovifaecis]